MKISSGSENDQRRSKVALSLTHPNPRDLGVHDQLEFGFDSWVVGGRNGPVFPWTYGDLRRDHSGDCIIVGARRSYVSAQRTIRGCRENS